MVITAISTKTHAQHDSVTDGTRAAKPLAQTEHRTSTLPDGPWVGHMNWHHLLFAHWPISYEVLRPLIPQGLALDTHDGDAWVGVVPFDMSGVRPRFSPNIPGFSAFPEINVRTYVTARGQPGVWFFSLDAANRLAVWGARTFLHLPYFNADIQADTGADGVTRYRCQRTHRGAPSARFEAAYSPAGTARHAEPGTLEHFLTERYCLYAAHKGTIYRQPIHHLPWPLQAAEWTVSENTMAEAAGIDLPAGPPLLHYAELQEVLVWPPHRAG